MVERPHITALAEAIADKSPCDWQVAEADARDVQERRLVSHLRAAAAIGQAPAWVRWPGGNGAEAAGSPPALRPGTQWGDLRVLEYLGHGRFGDVYRAWDPALDREVALKLLRDADVGDHGIAVVDEGRLMARVRHPNVVTVYGARRIDGVTGLWMELGTAPDLATELRATGPFAGAALVEVGRALCAALQAVHDAGLVHGDVKAQNVLRDSTGRVVLGDFGISREIGDLAARHGLAGTPAYLAPELFTGRPATPHSDIYSLGVLLFHLATGTFPATATTLGELRDAHARGRRRSLADARRDLPAGLTAAIDRALDSNPSQRFTTAREMAAALEPRHPWRAGRTVALLAIALSVAVVGAVASLRHAPADGPSGEAGPRTSLRTSSRPGSARAAALLAQARDLAGPEGGPLQRPHLVEQLAREALAEDPELVIAQVVLVHALTRQGKLSDALPAAEQAVAMAARGSAIDRAIARAELDSLRGGLAFGSERLALWRASAAGFEAALRLDPRHEWVLTSLAGLYPPLGRHADALAVSERLAALHPRSLTALWRAAVAADRLGDVTLACRYAERGNRLNVAIDERSAHQAGWLRLYPARLAWLRGDVAEASRVVAGVLREMDRLTPAAQQGFALQVVQPLLALGQLQHASVAASRLAPEARGFYMSRVVTPTLGHAATAVDRAEGRAVVAAYFPDVRRATNVISAYVLVDDIERARAALAQLETGQGGPPDYMRLARAHLAMVDGRPDRVIALLGPDPADGPPRGTRMWAMTRLLLANAHVAHGQPLTAIALLEDATHDRTDYAMDAAHAWLPLRHRLAELYRAAGRVALAEELERELRELLAAADVDHPLKRALGARSR